jgi:hypothetical protein
MAESSETRRIVIAVTETCPVAALWRAAIDAAGETSAELVVVFVDDERWQRIASLPFTREFPRLGGAAADFTVQRARQLLAESAARVKAEIDRLAAASGRAISFEMLAAADPEKTERLFGAGKHLCITTSSLTRHPLYTELTRLKLDIRFVDRDATD